MSMSRKKTAVKRMSNVKEPLIRYATSTGTEMAVYVTAMATSRSNDATHLLPGWMTKRSNPLGPSSSIFAS